MKKSGVAFVANLRMLMRGCVATATDVIESLSPRPYSGALPSLSSHSQFIPPTPFIHLAASSTKTMCSGSGSGVVAF